MSGRPLLLLGLASVLTLGLASCTKAESKNGPAPQAEPAAAAPVAPASPDERAALPAGKDDTKAKDDKPDSSFQLSVEQPGEVAAGGEAVMRVRVTPGTGYKMNDEFPTKLTLEPPAGVKLAKTTLALSDAEKFDAHQLVFAVKATPEAAGTYTIGGKLKFAVCTDATCDPKKRDIAFAVTAR